MNNTSEIIIYSSAAGFSIIIGGLLANLFISINLNYKDSMIHFITAFGGGALLSAIAFVLIPIAVSNLTYFEMIILFLAGTFTFICMDILSKKK